MYTPRLFVCYVFVPFSMSHFIYLLFFFFTCLRYRNFCYSHLAISPAIGFGFAAFLSWGNLFFLAPIDSKSLNIDIGAR